MSYKDTETVTMTLARYDKLMMNVGALNLLVTCNRETNVAVIDSSIVLELANKKRNPYLDKITEIEIK
ncbi:hypothetical protein HB816_08775 [Listeria booriae]|uniref:hypothetical protein n=1 Tax=Listeria booriae TaxID=1552123 RepID=UPI0016291334|nr:hypothetical protein [Listeria booriae]MBC1230536.1 hypothetical protein [Listeria booriae]